MKPIVKSQAHALILSVSVLFVLSIMGITFANYSVLNHRAAITNTQTALARMIADAGIERTCSALQDKLAQSLFDPAMEFRDWLCQGEATSDTRAPNAVDDGIGAAIPVENLFQQTYTETSGVDIHRFRQCRPSFSRDFRTRQVSGVLDNQRGYAYTLKIFDTTAKSISM